jgi:hypothetical protein
MKRGGDCPASIYLSRPEDLCFLDLWEVLKNAMIRFLNLPTVSFLALASVLAAPQCMAQTDEDAKSPDRLTYLDEG